MTNPEQSSIRPLSSGEVLNPPDYIVRDWFVSAIFECLDAAGVDTTRYGPMWSQRVTARDMVNELLTVIRELTGEV